jgi:hypothetical protein
MRNTVRVVCLSSVLVFNADAQQGPPLMKQEPVLLHPEERQVRRITIIANDLPSSATKKIGNAIQAKTCFPEVIQERVRQGLRDLGYQEPRVDEPQFAFIKGPLAFTVCDVSVHASPGVQYRLGTIQFEGNTAIAGELLRRAFAIETGGLFNATAISGGLDGIKKLYLSRGYINMGAIPRLEFDRFRHTIAMIVDIDEGKAWDFGRLLLEGPEPYAGLGNALIASWSLEGKRYNPELLSNWINVNAPFVRERDGELWQCTKTRFDFVTQRVDIVLELPWPDSPRN